MSSADGPIVVVGAGPVGLTVAYVMARLGLPVLVLEAGEEPNTEWRASTFHPPTLELYDSVGLAGEMIEAGLVARHFQMRDRQRGVFAEFDLQVLTDDTPFPYRLQYEQYKLVRLLQQHVAEFSHAELRFGSQVVGVKQLPDRVQVRVDQGGEISTVDAPYVCGADGAASTVRKSVGVAFDGLTYQDRFLLLSTTFPFERHLTDIRLVNYIADPDEYMMLLRIPDVWRVLFSVRPGDESAAITVEEGERRLQRVVRSDQPYQVIQRQIYRVHQRVADTFRVGRVLLLGDAAHVNSPFGGMGLNSGVHDAFDLSRRLARIVQDGASPRELDVYAQRRREFARTHVRAQTHRNTTSLAERDPVRRAENQAAMAAVAADPVRAREWLLDAAMLRQVRAEGIGEPEQVNGRP
ncbi:MAG: FAD-dependent oxidoreductase [Micromonosporaceae bacterium]